MDMKAKKLGEEGAPPKEFFEGMFVGFLGAAMNASKYLSDHHFGRLLGDVLAVMHKQYGMDFVHDEFKDTMERWLTISPRDTVPEHRTARTFALRVRRIGTL